MLGQHGRNVTKVIFSPLVNLLYAKNVHPNTVTIFGTFLACLVALVFIPTGLAWIGAIVLGIVLFTDSVDGMLARKIGKQSRYGAFLDSVLDRISDGVVFISIVLYIVFHMDGWAGHFSLVGCLLVIVFGSTVPYVRAKGQVFDAEPTMGVAERTDRLVVALTALGFTDLGLGVWILPVALWGLVVATAFTVFQRMRYVRSCLED